MNKKPIDKGVKPSILKKQMVPAGVAKSIISESQIVRLATDVFGDVKTAEEWLNEPHLVTGDKSPKSFFGTSEGMAHIETLLRRIEHGVLA